MLAHVLDVLSYAFGIGALVFAYTGFWLIAIRDADHE